MSEPCSAPPQPALPQPASPLTSRQLPEAPQSSPPRPATVFTTSADGTPIACHVEGSGPALVLVHGTGDTWMRWAAVIPGLARRFRVLAMDRRGRGRSGDGPEHSLEREVEDVAAVLRAASAAGPDPGGPPLLIGHSFGGILALEAALRTPVKKLILYEPPILLSGRDLHDAFVSRVDALLARGELEEIWVSFLRDVLLMTDEEIARYRESRSWKARVEMAALLPREAHARGSYRFDAARFRGFDAPTLLLRGTESSPELHAAVAALTSALPGSRVADLRGESHVAMSSAPELFLEEVIGFLEE